VTIDEHDPGYHFARGTLEQARAMIGTATPVRFAPVPVNVGMIRHFASLVRDDNPAYWDEEFADRVWGGVVAPPAMLLTWLMPMEWTPSGQEVVAPLPGQIPLPGETFINASHDCEYLAPIRAGDHLNMTEELVEVSDEKATSLGRGHFVTTVSTYRNQHGDVVARATNVLYRYTPHGRT
jgi:uncharacterized protein